MNIDELKDALRPYISIEDLGITVYAVIKGAEEDGPKRLDIEQDSHDCLLQMFAKRIRSQIVDRTEVSVMNLSDSDERQNVIYEYDLEIPQELQALQSVTLTDDTALLSLNDESLSQIKAIVVEIGNNEGQLVLYKTMAPINVFGRDKIFLKKHESRLARIDDEFLRISDGFQMLHVNGTLMVLDLKTLESKFGFHDVVKREAETGLQTIEEMGLLENPETLRELIDDVKFARKLTKVARSSPVLQQMISNDRIIAFCKNYPTLKSIKFNNDEDKILLDTQKSKDLFIKLLMDDYLVSQLTSRHYESLAKDVADADATAATA
ncbi:anti-phage protein KwaB [Rhodopirellula europaea]|uniref:DUF4868 domain-containing protein n=1 Tax=Rhodopirellula europaea SH398 TaxID=1263868 RepID=M5S3D3_9BACT|nr:anti-phage protein KwaB [Rhodopirellula europaea]EMI25971.1 hypothetical protein RESH_03446 [Rhodopirellula europaea SH398]